MSHVRRFDHVGITVADLDTATAFFVGLGLEVVEGDFLDTVIGILDSRTEIVLLPPPDGGTRLELSSFVRPDHEPGSPAAMANELGLRKRGLRGRRLGFSTVSLATAPHDSPDDRRRSHTDALGHDVGDQFAHYGVIVDGRDDTAPITRASGNQTIVPARYARNRRLGDALQQWAFCSQRGSPGARAYCQQLRDPNIGHQAALRQVATRLVGILHGCLKTHTPHNEHTARSHHMTSAA